MPHRDPDRLIRKPRLRKRTLWRAMVAKHGPNVTIHDVSQPVRQWWWLHSQSMRVKR